MTTPNTVTQQDPEQPTNSLSTWDEVRRMADELELKVHLASMDIRQRWREVEPRLARLEAAIVKSGNRLSEAIAKEVAALRGMLHKLRSDAGEN